MKNIVNEYKYKDFTRFGQHGKETYYYQCNYCRHRCATYSGIKQHIYRKHQN